MRRLVSLWGVAVVVFCGTVGLAMPGIALADPLVPPLDVKWSQLPDMDRGTDWLSMHRANGPVVADDFQSDGRLIVGLHWWGSYFESDPKLDPGQDRQVQFEVSFHPDSPVGPNKPFSTPGQPYQFQIVSAEETFFGATQGGEGVYEYWAKLGTPWEEVAGNIYWLDVAYAAGQFNQDPLADVWGWHESWQHWNDHAVTTLVPAGGNPHTGTWQLVGDGLRDMAFEVLTPVPEPCTVVIWSSLAGLGIAAGWYRRKRAG